MKSIESIKIELIVSELLNQGFMSQLKNNNSQIS